MARNPTIVATISAEDRTKAAITTATAALRELNKVMKSTGEGSFSGAAAEQRRLGEAIRSTAGLMNKLKTQTAAARSEVSLLSHALGNLKSLGAITIGGSVEHAGVKMVENAAHYEELKNKVYNVSGKNEKEVAFAEKTAGEVSRANPIVTQAQVLHDYLELRKLSANEDGTVNEESLSRNTHVMGRARAAAAAVGVPITEGDALNLAQAVEGSGRAGDPQAQKNIVDAYLRAKQVLGTAINAAMIRDFVANAKTSNFSLDDPAFLRTAFARLAQGNAARLGNEYSQTFNTLVGGKMTKQGAQWLADRGIINQDQIVDGKGGKFFIRGGVKDKDLLSTDPTKWSNDVLMKGLEARGAVSDDKVAARMEMLRKKNPTLDEHTSKERAIHGLVAEDVAKAGFRSTVADNLAHAIANEILTRKDVAQMDRATGLDAADTLNRNPVAAFNELSNAIQNFGTVLANPIMQTVAQVLDGIAQGVASFSKSLSDFQKEHPTAGQVIAGAVPAGAVVGGGALAWGILGGLVNGFGLKGSAVALTGSAEALTVAAARLGVGGTIGGGPAGGGTRTAGAAGGAAAAAAEGGIMYTAGRWASNLLKWGGRLLHGGLWTGAAGVGLDYADPEGNLWGLTNPVDEYVKKKTGVDPSKMELGDFKKWWDLANSALPPAWGGTAPGYPGSPMTGNGPSLSAPGSFGGVTLPKIETAVSPAAPIKTEVTGTISGETILNSETHVTVGLDGETRTMLRNATKIPVTGKLGTQMDGSNGTQKPSTGIGHN